MLKRKANILSGEVMIHPIIKLKNETMDHQSDKFKECCEKFVSHIGAQNCKNINHKYTTKCTCLLDLAEDTVTAAQAVALLQAHSGMSDEIRNDFLWSGKGMLSKGRMFILEERGNKFIGTTHHSVNIYVRLLYQVLPRMDLVSTLSARMDTVYFLGLVNTD